MSLAPNCARRRKVKGLAERESSVSVRVRIGGEEHPIRGDASAEYIQKIARIVDQRLAAVQNSNANLTRFRAAILVAINLADELEKIKEEHSELLRLMEEAQ